MVHWENQLEMNVKILGRIYPVQIDPRGRVGIAVLHLIAFLEVRLYIYIRGKAGRLTISLPPILLVLPIMIGTSLSTMEIDFLRNHEVPLKWEVVSLISC